MLDHNLQAINQLTTRFFDLFTNLDGKVPQVELIKDMFISEGIIINNTEKAPQIYNLEGFIAPRKKILTNGTLTDFHEWESSHKTLISGSIAHRYVKYEKSGKHEGTPFHIQGTKSIQFIKVAGTWKMVSVTWCDEQ